MTVWPEVSLGEVCDIISGATPKTSDPSFWGGDVLWATPKDLSELNGHYISDTPRKLTAAGLNSCAASLLPSNSVLLSSRAPIGHVAINTVPMATNQGFKSLIPESGVLTAKYLYWWLRVNTTRLESLGTGATFKEISKKVTERIEIPLPPIEEQRRIAAVLDAADDLRTKRRQALAKLDILTQAIFIDMFGDPLSARDNAMALGSLGSISTGKTPPTADDSMFGGTIPFVTPGDLDSDEPVKRTLTAAGAARTKVVPRGSTLVCCIGATIGKVGEAMEDSAFNQQINAVAWDRSLVVPAYGTECLRLMGREIARQGASTTLPILNKTSFARFEMPLPRIEDQNKFAERVRRSVEVVPAQSAALRSLEALFASLQQRAFAGDL